jgi:photosystem II stability/assembly factor-like uncharacterized protein
MKIIYILFFNFLYLVVSAQCVDIENINSIDSVATQNREYFQLQFINKDTGWVIDVGSHKILHTNDGARTWSVQSKDNSVYFLGCYFLNTQMGWATGIGTILHTVDGGKTWINSETKFYKNLIPTLKNSEQNLKKRVIKVHNL